MTSRLLGLTVVFAFWACRAESRKQTLETNADIRHVIDSLNHKLVAWYNAGQADSAATIFAHDVWAMPPNHMPIVGRDSLRSFQTNTFAAGKWDFDLKTDDVISADSIAVERGHYTLKVSAGPRAPYPSFEDHGNYIQLWRKESDGHWRTVWEAKVSTVPMPMPATPRTPTTPRK